MKTLESLSDEINEASDELSNSVDKINKRLKELNLGISSWYSTANYKFGYTKIKSHWGMAIAENNQVWLFADAPRELRIQCIDLIPLFFEKLVEDVASFIGQLKDAKVKADAMVKAINETK